ncbi:MAG: zinc ABC transporter substrate-binding protein [Caldilineaceae bacterium SB0661_bin_32]|uniref:Zinc ABC transporter substrate-binding protein n=1 Tax=Caldilineaceae bacterium SB0661_bin_32 TaxID=2605255 RepID=A0A6B1DB80_9CHLR|nr:zinc ABC transporter substrate-binding protein [Caldilineaceae bacterium SB0661_bin_32]
MSTPPRIFLLLALVSLLCACGGNRAEPLEERLQVVTTVSPLTNIVYNISGDHVELTGLVPAGADSHTFELAPSDAVTLASADLIFINGLDLETSAMQMAEANLKDGGEIVLLGEMVIDPEEYVFDFSFPEEAGSPNPHLWTDPIFALAYAEIVREKLTAHDPDNAEAYQANYDEFAARIEALDAAIQATTASIPAENRKLYTYHDSFAYFAPRYGYTVLGAIQPADFSEPSGQEVAALIDQLREGGVPAIFGSEVFPSRVVDQIGREAGVQFVSTLSDDDLPGNPGDPEHSYISMMVENLKTMAEALGGDPSLMDGVETGNVPGPDTSVNQ